MAAGDVVACHNGAKNKTGRVCASASYAPSLEKSELLPPRPDDPAGSNHRRPADVYLGAWLGYKLGIFEHISIIAQNLCIQIGFNHFPWSFQV